VTSSAQRWFGDGEVVIDENAFGVTSLREKNLGRIRNRNRASRHLDQFLFSLSSHSLTISVSANMTDGKTLAPCCLWAQPPSGREIPSRGATAVTVTDHFGAAP
jgi:hypothetical protein